jgi:hypothetical protein
MNRYLARTGKPVFALMANATMIPVIYGGYAQDNGANRDRIIRLIKWIVP